MKSMSYVLFLRRWMSVFISGITKVVARKVKWHSVLGSIWVPDIPTDRVEQRFREHLNDELLPITFVGYLF